MKMNIRVQIHHCIRELCIVLIMFIILGIISLKKDQMPSMLTFCKGSFILPTNQDKDTSLNMSAYDKNTSV